jgi:hypothetical protein
MVTETDKRVEVRSGNFILAAQLSALCEAVAFLMQTNRPVDGEVRKIADSINIEVRKLGTGASFDLLPQFASGDSDGAFLVKLSMLRGTFQCFFSKDEWASMERHPFGFHAPRVG